MADYKISLGIGLNDSDFTTIKKKINSLEENPIKIKVDTEVKELTKQINDALKTLSSGTENALKIDTSALTKSLDGVKTDITEIKNLLSSFGNGTNTKGLVSSISNIGTALDKVSDKFDELQADLKTLVNKDYSVNIGIKLGGSNSVANNAAYGDYVKNEVLPELKRQEQALTKYLANYFGTNEFNAVDKLVSSAGKNLGGIGGIIEIMDKLETPLKKSESLKGKMREFKSFINEIISAANIQGVDLSPVLSQFEKLPNELIESADKIRDGTAQVKNNLEELKNVFGSGVDAEKLSAQLDSIVTDLTEIKTLLQGLSSGASLDGLTQSFNKLSETLDKVIANAGNFKNAMTGATSGSSGTSGVAQDVEKVGVAADKAENEVNELKSALSGIKVDNAIASVKQEMEGLGATVQKVTQTTNKTDGSFSVKVTGVKELNDGLEQSITLVQRFNKQGVKIETQTFTDNIKKVDDAFLKLQNNAEKLASAKFATGMAKQFDDVKSSFDGLAKKTDTVEENFNSLKGKYDQLKSAILNYASVMSDSTADEQQKKNAMEQLIAANKEYQDTLVTTKNLIADNVKAERDAANAEVLTQKKNKLLSDINKWEQENTKAVAKYGDELRTLKDNIAAVTNDNDFRVMSSKWGAFTSKVKEAGDAGKTFGQTFQDAFARISQYLSAASLFNYASRGLKSMFEQVKAIDTAMTELKKVTDETDASYNKFLKNAASRAKELGTTIDGLVTSTADFARLGYGFEDAQELAEVANIYTVVGDEISGVEDATQSLISTMAAFKDEMGSLSDSDFALSIVDKFNEVDILAS